MVEIVILYTISYLGMADHLVELDNLVAQTPIYFGSRCPLVEGLFQSELMYKYYRIKLIGNTGNEQSQ